MREWFTCAELAGLPGVPTTERFVRERAKREDWTSRARTASGGGREYHISNLPPEAKAALLLRERAHGSETPPASERGGPSRAPTPANSSLVWEGWESRPESVKHEAERRLNAMFTVSDLMRDGSTAMEAYAVVAEELDVSLTTIRNWWRKVQQVHRGDWLPVLAPQYTGRTARAEYDPRIYQWFRDLYLSASRPAYATCYRRVQAIAAEDGLRVPSKSTLIREFERREDPAVVTLEREGLQRMLERFPYMRRSRAHFRALEALNADGHKLDLGVVWPDGEVVRPMLIAFQDLGSGMIVGWRLAKAETATDLALGFLSVCDDWGVPDKLWVDNTLAMAAKRLTAGTPGRKRFRDRAGDPEGVLTQLGIEVHWTETAHGQSKPIERAFRDLASSISRHPKLAGAYLGPNTQEKPHNYGERVVPVALVMETCEKEITRHNRQQCRDTEACGGKLSFWDVFERSYQEHALAIRRLTEPQRRLLYLISEQVTVRRDATVELFKNPYWSDALSRYTGRKVIVRYHPDDLHGAVYVYTLSGQLVAEATCIDPKGFDNKAAAEEHKRLKGQWARSKKKIAEIERRMEAAEVAALEPDPEPIPRPAAAGGGVVRGSFGVPSTLEQVPTVGPKGRSRRRRGREQTEAEQQVADALEKLRPQFERIIGQDREAG